MGARLSERESSYEAGISLGLYRRVREKGRSQKGVQGRGRAVDLPVKASGTEHQVRANANWAK